MHYKNSIISENYVILSYILSLTNSYFYPALVLFERSNCIDCINCWYIRSLTKIYFSGTIPVRQQKDSISDDTFENDDACFSYFQRIWQLFLLQQDKHNIQHVRTLSLNIKLISTQCETCQKSLPKVQFSTCF